MARQGKAARERESSLAQHWKISAVAAAALVAAGACAWWAPQAIGVPTGPLPFREVFAILAGIGALRMGAPALRGWSLQRKRDGLAAKRWTLARVMSMDWRDFETLTAVAFERQGWTVEQTGLGGADGGVDVVLRRGRVKALGQCKRHANAVGVKVAREILGEMHARGFHEAYVIASAGFTRDAEAFAETCKKSGNAITLIDGAGLIKMLGGFPEDADLAQERKARAKRSPKSPDEQARDAASAPRPGAKPAPRMGGQPPACPHCGSPMRPARARKGPSAGQWFWGCPQWPNCRGTRPDDGRILAWASKREAQKGA